MVMMIVEMMLIMVMLIIMIILTVAIGFDWAMLRITLLCPGVVCLACRHITGLRRSTKVTELLFGRPSRRR